MEIRVMLILHILEMPICFVMSLFENFFNLRRRQVQLTIHMDMNQIISFPTFPLKLHIT